MSDIANAVDRLELGIDLVAALDMACSDAPSHMRSPLRALAETAIAELKAARDELVTSMSVGVQLEQP